jgi:hypothetical protein
VAHIERHKVTITTDGTGAGLGYTELANGFVQAIRYVKDDFANGVDFTVTAEVSGATIWDQDDVNASATVYPRAPTTDTAGVASLYAGSGEPVETLILVANERIAIAIAAGGATKTGTFHVYVGG